MKIKHFGIGVDEDRTTFVPGQRIEGQVTIILADPVKVQLIRVRFQGAIRSQLYRNDSRFDLELKPTSSNTLTSTIFKDFSTVFGTDSASGEAVFLSEGEHVFPFVFRVPATNLPPSYETNKRFHGPKGRIKYELNAMLVRPGHSNKNVRYPITIPSSLDENDSEYEDSVEQEQTIKIGNMFSKEGHVKLKMSIPKAAFSIESTVPVTISIINQSGSALMINGLFIKQKVIFKILGDLTASERGPLTEKVHQIDYKEEFPYSIKDIHRIVNINIPSTQTFSSSIQTNTLDVVHTLTLKMQTCHSSSAEDSPSAVAAIVDKIVTQKFKIEIPIVISGFPFMLMDALYDRNVNEQLPFYQNQEAQDVAIEEDFVDGEDLEDEIEDGEQRVDDVRQDGEEGNRESAEQIDLSSEERLPLTRVSPKAIRRFVSDQFNRFF